MPESQESPKLERLPALVEAVARGEFPDLEPAIDELRALNPVSQQLRRVADMWGDLLQCTTPDDQEPMLFVIDNIDVFVEAMSEDPVALEILDELEDEFSAFWGERCSHVGSNDAGESMDPPDHVDDDWDLADSFDMEFEQGFDADDSVEASESQATLVDPAALQAALAEIAVQAPVNTADTADTADKGRPADTEGGPDIPSPPKPPTNAASEPIAKKQAPVIQPLMLEAFMDDAQRCLSALERASLELESTAGKPADKAVLQQIGRELHTLKGAAACVGLDEIADQAHAAEELLPTGNCAALIESIDGLSKSVEQLNESNVPEEPSLAPTPHSQCVRVGGEDAPSQNAMGEPSSGAKGPGGSVATAGEGTQRIRTSQLDRLMAMMADLVMLRNRRQSNIECLSNVHSDLARSVEQLRRLTGKFAQTMEGLAADDLAGCESTLGSLAEVAEDLTHGLRGLRSFYEPLTRDNDSVSQFIGQFRHELSALRRMPVSGMFHKLRRVAREAAKVEGKEIQLEFVGEETGLEPAIQERIYEPLMHMVRNSVSHGVETPDQRIESGKPRAGKVTLEASGSAHLIQLEIRDDGRGLDYEAIRRRGIERKLISPDRPVSRGELAHLIFHPGFSTRDTVSQISGRGVGMDVVADTLEKLRGWVEVDSEQGAGTTIRVSLPLPSVIQQMMVFRTGGQLYGIPMQCLDFAGANENVPTAIDARWLLSKRKHVASDSDQTELLWVQLDQWNSEHHGESVRASASGRALPMRVDEIIGPEEAVIRPLPPLLRHHPLVEGLSLSGNGDVVQFLDPHRLGIRMLQCRDDWRTREQLKDASQEVSDRRHDGGGRPSVLVVDDSKTARLRVARPLAEAGIDVQLACDGAEALQLIETESFSAVFTDLEMPVMDGFELLHELQTRNFTAPVIVVSTLQHETHRQRTTALGAALHLGKPVDPVEAVSVFQELTS